MATNPSSRPPTSPGASRLLVVEDDPTLGRLLARCFEHAGYRVRLATSAAAAEQPESRRDCGVFDIELADGDGISLAERMLRGGRIGAVVFYSATRVHAQIQRAEGVGPVVFKPARFELLMKRVAAAIARSKP